MDPVLSSDQRLFLETTRDFVDRTMSLTVIRDLASRGEGPDRGWWSRAAELGWSALLVPEESGGGSVSGDGLVDLSLVAEELGRGVVPGPLLGTNVVVAGLLAADGGPDHAADIEALAAGEVIATWAVYEPGRPFEPASPGLTARQEGEDWVLDGVKDRVEVGDLADLFLVTASTDAGPTQFLVPAATDGVSVTTSWSLDVVRHFAVLTLSEARVPAAALVGVPGGAATAVERQTQVAAVLQAAETVGVLARVFDMTVQWAFDRYSFGRPLASYQALKHRFADMKTWLEACAAISAAATRAVQDQTPDAPQLARAAASYVGAKAPEIVQDCVQIHGGIGVTWEHDLHLYLRRVTVNRSLYGTPEEQRRQIAALISTSEVAA